MCALCCVVCECVCVCVCVRARVFSYLKHRIFATNYVSSKGIKSIKRLIGFRVRLM